MWNWLTNYRGWQIQNWAAWGGFETVVDIPEVRGSVY